MAGPVIGSQIADFVLLNQLGKPLSLQSLRGQWVLVYFYPKALTPGCTTQACGLRDSFNHLLAHNLVTLGISPDPVAKLKKFHDRLGLNFDLLSDPGHQVADVFGVWALKKFMGKEFSGVIRRSFLISPLGTLTVVLDNFKTANHHQKVLEIMALVS